MCQLIFLGSVEPLPESATLELRCIAGPGQVGGDCSDLLAILPESRYLYRLGGCQCYFRYFPDVENAASLDPEGKQDKEQADTSLWYLASRNAYVANTADYLEDQLGRTPIWMVWKWEGQPVSVDCERWICSPSWFRQQDFTMPANEGVITVIPDSVSAE